MTPVRILRYGQNLKFRVSRLILCAGLGLVALLVLPIESYAAACTNPNPTPTAPHDFDGDCKADILWHNDTNGQVSVLGS